MAIFILYHVKYNVKPYDNDVENNVARYEQN